MTSPIVTVTQETLARWKHVSPSNIATTVLHFSLPMDEVQPLFRLHHLAHHHCPHATTLATKMKMTAYRPCRRRRRHRFSLRHDQPNPAFPKTILQSTTWTPSRQSTKHPVTNRRHHMVVARNVAERCPTRVVVK